MVRVLVACEYSGRVRDAFLAAGHDAVSCDLEPTEVPGPHIVGDALAAVDRVRPDLLIAHPPCTYLAKSGVSWLHRRPERWALMEQGAAFLLALLNAPVPHVAVENPGPHRYAKALIGHPTQWLEPHDYGELTSKRTGLWLRGLPVLLADEDGAAATLARPARDRMPGWAMSPGPDRAKERARTPAGIAAAMARQWGEFLTDPHPDRQASLPCVFPVGGTLPTGTSEVLTSDD